MCCKNLRIVRQFHFIISKYLKSEKEETDFVIKTSSSNSNQDVEEPFASTSTNVNDEDVKQPFVSASSNVNDKDVEEPCASTDIDVKTMKRETPLSW